MDDNTIEECARRMQCTTQTVENRLKTLARRGITIEVRKDPVDKRKRLIAEGDLRRIAAAYQEALLPPRIGMGAQQGDLASLEVELEVAGSDGLGPVERVRMELEGLKLEYQRELELLRASREQHERRFRQLIEETESWLGEGRRSPSTGAERDRSP
jgi:DNA-binding MarR family transcriptional regulator